MASGDVMNGVRAREMIGGKERTRRVIQAAVQLCGGPFYMRLFVCLWEGTDMSAVRAFGL